MRHRWSPPIALTALLCAHALLGCSGEAIVGGRPDVTVADAQPDVSAPDVTDVSVTDTADGSAPDVSDVPDLDADVADADVSDADDVPADDGPTGCTRNADCMGDAGGAVCDLVTGRCVGCVPSDDTCPTNQRCDPATYTCVAGCRNDAACATATGDGGTAARYCDPTTYACVACVTDAHCPGGQLCRGNVCVAACTVTGCPTGQQCCSGACIDVTSNTAACGACGSTCSAPNATPACVMGACTVGTCAEGYADCDGALATGCELDVRTSAANCGGCGRACPPVTNGVAECRLGTCGFTCATGFGDCDGDANNGCETALTGDVANCGACGTRCAVPANGTAACVMGACAVATCNTGFGNCDRDTDNGCETNLNSTANHCGACGNACPAGQVCNSGRCEIPCPRGLVNCAGECVSLAYDPDNCGRCGNRCATGALCGGGMCVSTCGAGQVTCAGGCTNTQTDASNCGACGTVCPAGQACQSGVCRVVCVAGQDVCGGSCVDLQSNLLNCGSCGNVCGPGEQCQSGRCALTCRDPQVVCGGECADLSRDPNHCGSCDRVCPTGCFGGACARVDTIEAGTYNNCVRYTSGRLYCWGLHAASSTFTTGLLTAAGGAYGHRAAPTQILEPGGTSLEAVEQVAMGANRVCARHTNGSVRCWAYGTAMGIVSGLPEVAQLAARETNFVALAVDGRVFQWDGLPRASTAPALTPAVTLPGVATQVTAGVGFACARLADRTVACWGTGTSGQLGNGASLTSATPVLVRGLTDAEEVVAGASFACARRTGGALVCWGLNSSGQLGDGTVTARNAPVAVMGLTGVTVLEAGLRHACAVVADGSVRCWGENVSSQLGDGTTTNRTAPVAVMGLSGAQIRLAAYDHHTCAVGQDRRVLCWGANPFGEAAGGTEVVPTPAAVQYMGSDLNGIVDVRVGQASSPALMATTQWRCALHNDGRVFCWGASNNANSAGQLGDGTTTNRATPAPVTGLTDATAISVGWLHACALRRGGTVVCWGSNAQGQLGDGTTTNRTTPVAVTGLTGAVELSSGDYHTCARRSDGSVWCWGYNYYGELGDSTMVNRSSAAAVMALTNAAQITSGSNHTCARRADGTVWCWGRNLEGQLGDGFRTNRSIPYPVQAPTATASVPVSQGGFTDVQCDYFRCYGTVAGGAVMGWGWNYPVRASVRPELSGVTYNRRVVVFGEPIDTECEIRADGQTYCRGRNEFGQVGVGRASFSEPTFASVSSRFSTVTLGRGYGTPCAVERTGGRVYCWGWAGFNALLATGNNGLSTRPFEVFMP